MILRTVVLADDDQPTAEARLRNSDERRIAIDCVSYACVDAPIRSDLRGVVEVDLLACPFPKERKIPVCLNHKRWSIVRIQEAHASTTKHLNSSSRKNSAD